MMYYVGERKVNATFYVDKAHTETRTLTQTFKACAETIDKCRESLNKQVARYADNPYMIEVKPISEHFAN